MTRYVVISPVRDEEKYLEGTLKCVIGQTSLPAEWVIVDDGSSDGTGGVLDRYAAQYPWIRAIHRPNRGFRKSGGGVMEAFFEGYNSLQCHDWDFIVKLDGDLSFAPDYFEKCFEYFRREPSLGIGGGDIYHVISGQDEARSKIRSSMCGVRPKFIGRLAGTQSEGSGCPQDGTPSMKSRPTCWAGRLIAFRICTFIITGFTGTADGFLRDRVKHGKVCYVSRLSPPLCVGQLLV